MNEVLVNSPLLEEYIRKNYPGYKIILSTTREIKTVEGIEKEALNDYYIIVLDKSFNNTDKLAELKDKDRYEMGYNKFKLDGRAFNVYTVMESYMYYLVKPLHRDKVRLSVLKALERLER